MTIPCALLGVKGHRGQHDVDAQRLQVLQVYQEEPDLFRIK